MTPEVCETCGQPEDDLAHTHTCDDPFCDYHHPFVASARRSRERRPSTRPHLLRVRLHPP